LDYAISTAVIADREVRILTLGTEFVGDEPLTDLA